MFRIVLVGVLAAFAVALAQPSAECIKLTGPHAMMCCKSTPHLKQDEIETAKECFEKFKPPGPPPRGPPPPGPPPGPPPCDIDTCIAKKSGVLSDDGVIDKKAFLAEIKKDFEDSPVVVEAIEKKCINGDINNYGGEDMCEIMKMRHCYQTQVILTCPDFDDSGHCNGLKDLTEKCMKEF